MNRKKSILLKEILLILSHIFFLLSLFLSIATNLQAQQDTIFLKSCDTTLMYFEVYNPKTGRIWLDRNLGALQIAESETDYNAYGSLYQWGRFSDGHECIDWESSNKGEPANGITKVLSDTPKPDHSRFIIAPILPGNWLEPRDPLLWEDSDSENNPCPDGFRVPTEEEWLEEINSWDSKNQMGAFNSVLKLPLGGGRSSEDGNLMSTGVFGQYWSSDFSLGAAKSVVITGISRTGGSSAAFGFCVRCIKDITTGVENNNEDELNLFPNPASDFINIQQNYSNPIIRILVYNSYGKLLDEFKKTSKLDFSEYNRGIYFLNIITKNQSHFQKLILE